MTKLQQAIKESAQEAMGASTFIQKFKLKCWELGFKGEKELDELAMWCIDENKEKIESLLKEIIETKCICDGKCDDVCFGRMEKRNEIILLLNNKGYKLKL